MEKISRTKLIQNILNYVFNTYCDDEQIALFAKTYYDLEKKAMERKENKANAAISKPKVKTYKISQEVRDFLEPIVDAEYFKETHYKNSIYDLNPLYLAMEQLETKQYKKLIKRIKKSKKRNLI